MSAVFLEEGSCRNNSAEKKRRGLGVWGTMQGKLACETKRALGIKKKSVNGCKGCTCLRVTWISAFYFN